MVFIVCHGFGRLEPDMTWKWAWNSKQPWEKLKKNFETRSLESSGATCAVIVEITGAVDYLEIKSHKQIGCAISHKKIWPWEILMSRNKQGHGKENGEAQNCMNWVEMFGELQGAAAPCELGPRDLWKERQVLGGADVLRNHSQET